MSTARASFPSGGTFPKEFGSRSAGGRTDKGASVRFSVTGLDKVADRFRKMHLGISDVMKDCLVDVLTEVKDESQYLVPVDTGFLQNSAAVVISKRKRATWAGTVTYRAFYAMWVHENLAVYHKPPTQAKFLEVPFAARKAGVAAEVAKRIREELMG